MHSLQNIAISASAGSGKTYQLTNRFIYLLHLTEAPERIIALTFTRAAAGEFFDRIMQKLARAAASESSAASLSSELEISADSRRYQILLRIFINSFPKLNLQTLDSFFFKIVGGFSLELGLPGSIKLMSEMTEAAVHRSVRDNLIHSFNVRSKAYQSFASALESASYGRCVREIDSEVEGFIRGHYQTFLETEGIKRWADIESIWPTPSFWQGKLPADFDRLADSLVSSIPETFSKAQRRAIDSAAQIIRGGQSTKLNALLKSAFAAAQEICSGQAEIKIQKTTVVDGTFCQNLAAAISSLFLTELKQAVQITQGIEAVVSHYHQDYHSNVRSIGSLGFSDLPILLGKGKTDSALSAERAFIDFRLDGQYDHWLFDEFQDTSRAQWAIVADLIDEVLQDASGERSLFYVGDTKQCLYLWRNGDDRLFHEIRATYTNIEDKQLSQSWRSSPPVLEAVNELFDNQEVIAECFSKATAARWLRSWEWHTPSPLTESLPGYVVYETADPTAEDSAKDRLLQHLQAIDPIARQLSVSVLVRKNSEAIEVANFLRDRTGFRVYTSSVNRPAVDNLAGRTLLAILYSAAHPSDTFNFGYLRLFEATHAKDTRSVSQIVRSARRIFATDGAYAALRSVCQFLKQQLAFNDARHRDSLDFLQHQGALFALELNQSLDGLIEYLQSSTMDAKRAEGSIVVETIHRSKGLEYDAVFLLDSQSRSQNRTSEVKVFRDAVGQPEWLIKPFKKELFTADPQLAQLHTQIEEQDNFATLCSLYVAMTRAKHGLYIIVSPKGAVKGSAVSFLDRGFGGSDDCEQNNFSVGDPTWYTDPILSPEVQSNEHVEAAAAAGANTQDVSNGEKILGSDYSRRRLTPVSASEAEKRKRFATAPLKLSSSATEYGIKIHKAFESLSWLDADEVEVDPMVTSALFNEAVRELFTQRGRPIRLFREKAFAFTEDKALFKGRIDRLHLFSDDSASIKKAEIIDFKTDRFDAEATDEELRKPYLRQMEIYRKAVSNLVGKQPIEIAIYLLFTRSGRLVHIAASLASE